MQVDIHAKARHPTPVEDESIANATTVPTTVVATEQKKTFRTAFSLILTGAVMVLQVSATYIPTSTKDRATSFALSTADRAKSFATSNVDRVVSPSVQEYVKNALHSKPVESASQYVRALLARLKL